MQDFTLKPLSVISTSIKSQVEDPTGSSHAHHKRPHGPEIAPQVREEEW